MRRVFFLFVFLSLNLAIANDDVPLRWQPQTSGTTANFRGLSAVSETVAWVSGTNGTVGRTIDGGRTWTMTIVPGAESLDFRDIEAFNESTAYAMSAGPGEKSRIYKTTDGGKTWAKQWTNLDTDPNAFTDAIAFWDERNGIAMGDPVRGQFQILVTNDGGANWKPLSPKEFPAALPKEGAFAASGTCLITRGTNDVWIATGGAKTSRLFHSADRGQTWTVHETPIAAYIESAGIFSITFRDRDRGMIVGGDYKKPQEKNATVAMTADGGKTWTLTKQLPYCSAVAWAKDRWIAVGPTGSFQSLDDGTTWSEVNRESVNSVAFVSNGSGWAAGEKGRILRIAK